MMNANAGERDLHAACEKGDIQLCISLLNRGVNVNARDSNHATPLIRAVICNHVDVVNVIMHMRVEVQCSVYSFDKQVFSAFHWAVMLGLVDVVSVMTCMDKSLLTRPDETGRTPLFLCSVLRPNSHVCICESYMSGVITRIVYVIRGHILIYIYMKCGVSIVH